MDGKNRGLELKLGRKRKKEYMVGRYDSASCVNVFRERNFVSEAVSEKQVYVVMPSSTVMKKNSQQDQIIMHHIYR